MRLPFRALAVAGLTAGGAAAGAGVVAARRHAAVREAAPELRHPVLYAPVPALTDGMVRAAQRVRLRPGAPVRGVERAEHAVPDGDRELRVVTYDPSGSRSVGALLGLVGAPGSGSGAGSASSGSASSGGASSGSGSSGSASSGSASSGSASSGSASSGSASSGGARRGALLWIHGGGTVIGAPEQDDELCSDLARRSGTLVVSVDYRLAPAHPFPAALDDCARALEWLRDQAPDLRVDPRRIAVGGSSAGGGLAAVLAQRAHDEGRPVAFQLLVYPMLDDRTVLRPDDPRRGRLVWTPVLNRYAWTAYLGGPPRVEDDRAYIAASRREDLSGLPPAWVGVGDLDLFYGEDVAYASRLGEADVEATVYIVGRMYHAADYLRPQAPLMLAFRDRMVEALLAAIGPAAQLP